MATLKPNPAQKAADAAGEPAGGQALKVVPKIDGFRRAGRVFSGEQIIPLSELTAAQCRQLEAEPLLVTTRVALPGSPAAEAA